MSTVAVVLIAAAAVAVAVFWFFEKRNKFEMRPISPEDRRRLAEAWKTDQAAFVDEPRQAIVRGHELVDEVMKARGYPVSADFQQNAADLSVDYPHVVEQYRLASEIAARREAGQANTEDLRNAVVSYRTLFEELLGIGPVNQAEEVKR